MSEPLYFFVFCADLEAEYCPHSDEHYTDTRYNDGAADTVAEQCSLPGRIRWFYSACDGTPRRLTLQNIILSHNLD